jgi:2-polyprenyl-3-methyl-5-hydroxy-6-metoxy-1,4-benzoquinol methylase
MQFKYKDVDEEGLEILMAISNADKFNKWTYQVISPFCKGKILEIGSGVGNISQHFINEKKSISLSDIRSNYRELLNNKFGSNDHSILDIDIAHPNFNSHYQKILGEFDSIICLNVVEHIENDDIAIKNMIKLLKNDGHLIVLVPAFQSIFNNIDRTLEHYRRYNNKTVLKLMAKHGLPIKTFYFNSMGVLAWFISGKILKNRTIPEGQMKIYNYLVPLIKLIDKLIFKKMGLSIVCVIKKTE